MTNKPNDVRVSQLINQFETYEVLARMVRYVNADIVWENTARADLIGKLAGRSDKLGYRHIEKDSKMFAVHRLIYFIHRGVIPQVIDHIDGNVNNNSIENLRPATVSQNAMNCKVFKNNSSGVKGVSWHKATSRWIAYIRIEGRQKSLGLFESIFEAACVRRSAESRYYGEFSR